MEKRLDTHQQENKDCMLSMHSRILFGKMNEIMLLSEKVDESWELIAKWKKSELEVNYVMVSFIWET